MDAFRRYWHCVVILLALAAYSFIAGCVLETLASSSQYSAHKYLSGRPLAPASNWLYQLEGESGYPFFWLCFYPTLACAAYLWHVMRNTVDATKCWAKFALVTLASFIVMSGFTLFCICFLAMPFLPFFGGFAPQNPPLQTPTQQSIFLGMLMLSLLNALLFFRMCRSRSRDSTRVS